MRFHARLMTLLKALIQVKAHSRKGKNGQVAQVQAHTRYIQSAAERKEMIAKLAADIAHGREPKHKTAASALGLARHLSKQEKGATYHVARTEDGHHVVRKGEAPHGGDRIHVKAGKATLHRADGETRSLKHLKGPVWLEGEAAPHGMKAPGAAEWAKDVLAGKETARSFELAPISKQRAEEIKTKTGLDVSGFKLLIEADYLRHIENRHGQGANQEAFGQRAITPEDIARLPEIVEHGSIEPAEKGTQDAGRIKFNLVAGERLVTIQAVRKGKKNLATVTLYAYKKRGAEASPQSVPGASVGGQSGENAILPSTSETAFGATPDTPTVPQAEGAQTDHDPSEDPPEMVLRTKKPQPEDVDLSHLSDEEFLREGCLKLKVEEGGRFVAGSGYTFGYVASGANLEAVGQTQEEAMTLLRGKIEAQRTEEGHYPSSFFMDGVPLHLLAEKDRWAAAPPKAKRAGGTTSPKTKRQPRAIRQADAAASDDPPQGENRFAGKSLGEMQDLVGELVDTLHGLTAKAFDGNQMAFALEKDDKGFNAGDFEAAKRWRGLVNKSLTDYVAAAQMLRKYHRQIGGQATIDGLDAFIKAANSQGYTIWSLGNGKTDTSPPPMRITRNDDGTCSVQFRYNPDLVQAVQRIVPFSMRDKNRGLGFQEQAGGKVWKVTAEGANLLLQHPDVASKVGIELNARDTLSLDLARSQDEHARVAAMAAASAAAQQAAVDEQVKSGIVPAGTWRNREKEVLASPPLFTISGEVITDHLGVESYALKFPYDPTKERNDLARACGAKWDMSTKKWLLPKDKLAKALATISDLGVSQEVFEANAHLFSKSDAELLDPNAHLTIHSKEDTSFTEPEGWSTHKMHDYQRKGASWLLAQKKGILGFGVGLGKCLGKGTPVMLHDGSIKPVEEVQPGDRLMGPDSQPREVLCTNRGRGELFQIQPSKGESWICNDIHVLTLRQSVGGEVFDIPLDEYLARRDSRALRDAKLFRAPVNFPSAPTAIDPYLLGVWLGDGSANRPHIHTADQPIVDYLTHEARKLGLEAKVSPQKTCIDVYLTNSRGSRDGNPVLEEIRRCQFGGEKRIPINYLRNGRDERLRLLAGLVDTDGFLAGGCFEVTTKFTGLKDDLLFLARSLGFAAYASTKVATIKATGFSGNYWRILISGELSLVPCILERRKAPARKSKKDVTNTGFDVAPVGPGEYYGFTLSGDGRFLLGDFTVTHNTNISIAAACKTQEKNPRPVVCVVPGKRLYGWKNDIEAAMPGKKVLVIDHSKDEREQLIAAGELEKYDFVICTYRMNVLMNDHLAGLAPAAVIFDEAHKLKGAKTEQTKAGKKLSDASEHVWDLTATPMPNRPEELEQLIKRNHPGAIRKGANFNRFYNWEGGAHGSKVTGIKDPEGLAAAIAPFVFVKRSTDTDVSLKLPKLRELRTHVADWDREQRKMYDAAHGDIVKFIEDLGKDPSAAQRAKVLVMMGKLEQIAISPALVDERYTKRSPKLQELCDAIENRQGEFPGKGHVVFCRFTKALDLAKAEVLKDGLFMPHEVATIDGTTPKKKVAEIEKALNAGTIKAVFCSDAAMEGLNFQKGANHLVNLDTPWSPYFSEQRHGRVYRQGQEAPVLINTLAMSDSIEARKALLWGKKDSMIRSLFGDDGHRVESVGEASAFGEDGAFEKKIASSLSMQDILDVLG